MNKKTRTGFTYAATILSILALPQENASAEKIEGDETLIPPVEKKALGKHKVDIDSATFKPGKGLAVDSEDGTFSLVTRLRIQGRIEAEDAEGEDATLGLILRRARLQFLGHVFGKHNKFKAEFAFSPRDLRMKDVDGNVVTRESPLLSWYMEIDKLRDLTVRAGQYKIPFSRQRVISSGNQQLVDRSIANGEFNLDRDIGIDIRSKDFLGLGFLKYYLGIYNGEGRSAFSYGDTNLMYLGRVEVLPLGMYKDYSEADFERLATPGLSIGLSYAYAKKASGQQLNRGGGPEDGGTTDFHNIAADINLKYMGASFSSEFFWREGDRNPGSEVDEFGLPLPVEEARSGYGWMAQAGYLLPARPIEIAARYGQVRASDTSSISDSNEAGFALSHYFAGHPFKIQGDLFQLWGNKFSDGATRGRVQVQMAF